MMGKEPNSPARIALRGQQTYNVSSAASFAETVIRSLFGFEPDYSTDDVLKAFSDSQPRGFCGELRNVSFHGAFYNIKLDEKGRHISQTSVKASQ